MPSLFLVIEDSKHDIVAGNGNLSFLICPYFFLPSSEFGYWKFLWILRDRYS